MAGGGGHILGFGGEGHLLQDGGLVAQLAVVGVLLMGYPPQQGALGGVAHGLQGAVGLTAQVGGGVDGYATCQQGGVGIEMVFGHLELVHGQCAGLVGTDYGGGAHRLAGVQFAHQVVLFQHLAHAQRQTHGDAERQAFGHGHHHERDGDEDAVEQKLGQLECLAVVGHVAVEEEVIDHPAHDDEGGHDVAGPCNPAAQVVELLVERCAHGALLAEDFGAAALFGLGAHGRDPVVAVALYHGAAAQQEVARVGGVVGAVVAGGYAFGGEHLAGEGALVDVERERAQQLAVGGHLVAALQLHHIAHHHVAFLDLQYVGPVVARPAQHLDGSLVLALVEHAELALGAHFEDETHAGGQEQGHEHAGRFDEGGPGFAVQLNLIDGDAEREEEDHQ